MVVRENRASSMHIIPFVHTPWLNYTAEGFHVRYIERRVLKLKEKVYRTLSSA